MPAIEVKWDTSAAAGIAAQLAGIDRKLRQVVADTADLLVAQVRANASGRPGPNIITGQYVASWTIDTDSGAGEAAATVGTNAPQAQRLERGFYGSDSIGRSYAQPPFPHLGPAVDTVGPSLRDAVERAISG